MVKNHLKVIAAPRTWPIQRKNKTFTIKPSPGPHKLKDSISLNLLLTDLLKLATVKKEVKYLLSTKEILVDNKRRKERSFPVGLFDVITIKDTKKNYRILLDKKGTLQVIEIDEKDAAIKPDKIIGKTLHKGKVQLNLFDGRNITVEKDNYKVGDTVLLDFAANKIKDHYQLSKGNTIFLVGGKQIGMVGTVEDVTGNKIIYKRGTDEVYETSKKYAYVIGKDKSTIKIE